MSQVDQVLRTKCFPCSSVLVSLTSLFLLGRFMWAKANISPVVNFMIASSFKFSTTTSQLKQQFSFSQSRTKFKWAKANMSTVVNFIVASLFTFSTSLVEGATPSGTSSLLPLSNRIGNSFFLDCTIPQFCTQTNITNAYTQVYKRYEKSER